MGTDGLFDNLYDEQILEIVNKTIGKDAAKIDWTPTHQTCKVCLHYIVVNVEVSHRKQTGYCK